MSRQERKNMIQYIEKVKNIEWQSLVYMTDAEIEHIYNTSYFLLEEIAE